jgi:hypothetical protein
MSVDDPPYGYNEIPQQTLAPTVEKLANIEPMSSIPFTSFSSNIETPPTQLENMDTPKSIDKEAAQNSTTESTDENRGAGHELNVFIGEGMMGGMGALIEGVRAWAMAQFMHAIQLRYQIAKIKEYTTSFNNNVNKIAEAKRSMSSLSGVPNQTVFTSSQITSAIQYGIKEADKLYLKYKNDPKHCDLTWCNKGVYYAFNKLTGNTIMSNMNAENMLEHWGSKSNDAWKLIDASNAQSLANKGNIIVAGTSDHVSIVSPGEDAFSGTWNSRIPMMMNTGKYPGVLREKLSLSWSPSEVNLSSIKFYQYVGY